MIKGQVISGEFGKIVVRQKSDQNLEIGELLVAENQGIKTILQVYGLQYGSQLSQQNLELISGLKLEEENDLEIFDAHMRNYNLALLKPLIASSNNKFHACKILPPVFSQVREITKEDFSFLQQHQDAIVLGKIRSGSKEIDVDISLPGREVLSHHILIAGTTGRGKSVLIKNILWSTLGKGYCGMLVLDPHDEYYGRTGKGLNAFEGDAVSYYTLENPPVGAKTLKINIKSLKPHHFDGVVNFSDPQQQALIMYHKEFGNHWIESLIIENKLQSGSFREETLAVVRRRMLQLLDISYVNNTISCRGVFDVNAGEAIISSICNELEQAKCVIIDTSHFSGATELLIGSIITTEVFNRYRRYKRTGELAQKPIISIVLEEAPRVLGKEVLERGSNIFSTIAREGRKFQVGLTAITQLPSLIPRQILANMNTKIILGIEMKPERQALIDSAAQDLSEDDRNIASLDKGEAIVTSNFTKFAMPIKIPFFDEVVKKQETNSFKKDFSEIT